eukprot:SAG11_NODE_198_length_12679_cov_7.778537_1_plen_171_part_00
MGGSAACHRRHCLQTGNVTGAVEFWLNLNSMWGLPKAAENSLNNTAGLAGTIKQRAPYPRIVTLGGLTLRDADFEGDASRFHGEQIMANGEYRDCIRDGAIESPVARLARPVHHSIVHELLKMLGYIACIVLNNNFENDTDIKNDCMFGSISCTLLPTMVVFKSFCASKN